MLEWWNLCWHNNLLPQNFSIRHRFHPINRFKAHQIFCTSNFTGSEVPLHSFSFWWVFNFLSKRNERFFAIPKIDAFDCLRFSLNIAQWWKTMLHYRALLRYPLYWPCIHAKLKTRLLKFRENSTMSRFDHQAIALTLRISSFVSNTSGRSFFIILTKKIGDSALAIPT